MKETTSELITIEQVKKVATLVKVNVDGQEERLAQMFGETLSYIKILDELFTNETEGTYQVTGLVNVFQEAPHNKATLSQEAALQNAKDKSRNLFATKAVFNRS